MCELDQTDSSILNRIQSDFPITSRPFLAVANELGLSEKEVLDRVVRLKADGIIRRIGGNFVPGKLGFVSTLCAASVPADKIDHFAEIVNRYPDDRIRLAILPKADAHLYLDALKAHQKARADSDSTPPTAAPPKTQAQAAPGRSASRAARAKSDDADETEQA